MESRIILLFLAVFIAHIHASTSDCTPSQIHISLGDSYYSASSPINQELDSSQVNNNQAYLVWQSPAAPTPCQYVVVVNDVQAQQEVLKKAPDSFESFTATFQIDNETTSTSFFSYTVLLTGLSYGITYNYSILDQSNTSLAGPYQFNLASPNVTSSSSKIIVAGNLGAQQNDTMTLEAINELLSGNDTYAGLLQIGAVPYYLQNGSTDLQNEMNASLPYFTPALPLLMLPGRGEASSNSSFVDFRIRNPLFDATENQYFSFNLQGIHFVSINLDYYNLDTTNQSQVYSWLASDLNSANSTAARESWPFIVAITSYPLYCTSNSENTAQANDCSTFFGLNDKLADLFTDSNVDLVISGGMNTYEQLLPTDQDSTTQAQNSTLTNPNSTVYVIEGVGSSLQSGVRPGFGVLYAQNSSADSRLIYEHYESDTGDKVDTLTLVKTSNQGNTPTPPVPNDNTQNPGDNTQTPGDNTQNPGDNTSTNTTDNTPTPPTPNDNTQNPGDNTNTNTPDNNQNPNNNTATPTNNNGLEGPTEETEPIDPEEPASIIPRLVIPFVIILVIVLAAIYWKRRKPDPEMESLTLKEYKSNKIYSKRSTDASISMVDLVL